MTADRGGAAERLVYTTGLDRVREAVVSSHFMQRLAGNPDLDTYSAEEFAAKCVDIDARTVYERLIPSIMDACSAFCRERALAAKSRARTNCHRYGIADPAGVGTAEFVTEVMFDQQYLRGPRERCSREQLCCHVRDRIRAGAPIKMVIPALPLKFFSPLKTRGRLPDLAELNFILGLYEIAATVELVYREARPDLPGALARFTVVSDGSRFNAVINERDSAVETYRLRLAALVRRLRLDGHIELLDYRTLLRERLPAPVQAQKAAIARQARIDYRAVLGPIFDPNAMATTMRAAAQVEPDPESANRDGRFASLLKSLVFTIDYRALAHLKRLPADEYRALYRDLTANIFRPYAALTPPQLAALRADAEAVRDAAPAPEVKECLRQAMLSEVWTAAIDYLAEIKSDRELPQDPILTCLPDHIRWTIHAKAGQLALLAPTAAGMTVLPWAGAAVFRGTRKNRIKLCTLPVLALEGVGAVPVRVRDADDVLPGGGQPYFYIHPDVACRDVDGLLAAIRGSLDRRKAT
ncbi:L-tyrosine/L-tryptophan isonitrile synthase family protein [Actinokineospora sp. NPDC004072]